MPSSRLRPFLAVLFSVAVVGGTYVLTGSIVAAAAAVLGLLVVAIAVGLWIVGQVERLTGQRFSLRRAQGLSFEVVSPFGVRDLHNLRTLSSEYGEMGRRIRRSLELRDDESRILELISADADRLAVLNTIAEMLGRQAPRCRFRFLPNDMVRADQVDRSWPVADASEVDSGWVLQAMIGGPDAEPDPDVIVLGVDLARLTLFKARDRHSLAYQANHDVLTGLLSRRAILGELDRAIGAEESVGLIYGDVDHFKTINDRLGHLAGDEMLKEIAARINEQVASSGLRVASGRLGGDEYLCVLAGCTETQLRHFVEQMGFSMRAPFTLGSITTSASMSWGAAHHDRGACDSSDLLRQADVALYQVKRSGRNAYRIFDEELRKWTEDRSRLEDDLARSIAKRSGVHAEFQPQFDADRTLVGFEALGRWYRQGVGPVSPGEFIPVAVERGLMAQFDHEMFRHVVSVLGQLRKAGQRFGDVSINVSAEWLERPEFVDETLNALRNASVDPRIIVLEITESSLLRDLSERGRRLEELRRWGIRIAVDDFGTGYSSLSYLRSLPIDIVKLDKEFVSEVDASADCQAIVQAILDLAVAMDLKVIAEGVERDSQFETLVALGCRNFQGFLLGRPMPLEQATDLAASTWHADPFQGGFDWEADAPEDLASLPTPFDLAPLETAQRAIAGDERPAMPRYPSRPEHSPAPATEAEALVGAAAPAAANNGEPERPVFSFGRLRRR